jgi:hypothetical protein
MAQSRRERLQKQRERQRAYRAAGKEMRKSSRDDVARALLHWAVTENIRHGREKELFRLQRHIIDQLVVQGFDGQACDAAFDDLVDKYRAGWAFRRKPHLQSRNGDEDGDG